MSVRATLVMKQPLQQALLPYSAFERRCGSLRLGEAAYQGEIDEGRRCSASRDLAEAQRWSS